MVLVILLSKTLFTYYVEIWSIIVNWLPWAFVVIDEECVSNVYDPTMYGNHMEDV